MPETPATREGVVLLPKRAARVLTRKSFLNYRTIPQLFLSPSDMSDDLREPLVLAAKGLDAEVYVQPFERPTRSLAPEALASLVGRADIFVGVVSRNPSDVFRLEYGTAIGLGAPTLLLIEDIPQLKGASDALIFTAFGTFRSAADLQSRAVEVIGRFVTEVRGLRSERAAQRAKQVRREAPTLRAEAGGVARPPPTVPLFDERRVLVIGKDSDAGSRATLSQIASILQDLNYQPLFLRDIPDNPNLTIERKFLAVASIAFLVIAEDSKPSGHLDETKVCEINGIVTAFVREAGHGSTWMQAHFPFNHRFMNLFCYATQNSLADSVCQQIHPELQAAVKASVDWASSYYAALRGQRGRMYPPAPNP